MNILNQSDLSNRPVIKYIIIALIAANAVILALLLFGPERLIPAASAASYFSSAKYLMVRTIWLV